MERARYLNYSNLLRGLYNKSKDITLEQIENILFYRSAITVITGIKIQALQGI